MKFKIQNSKFKNILLISSYLLLVTTLGCDAFVRKFTRKAKRENLPKEEMVLVPQKYNGPQMTKEELYRQYFLFWKSWHDELIQSLLQRKSQKKQIDCAQEAIKNLINLKEFLTADAQKKLDVYISQLKGLRDLVARDLYGNDITGNLQEAENLKRNILRGFSYNKISKDISYGTVY